MPLTALFFDVGNTLLFPNRRCMLRSLHAQNVFPPEELMQEVERQTKREFDALLESRASVDHSFWQIYYSRLLKALAIADDSICSDLVARTRVSANWCDIRPGTQESLQRLKRKYRLGVISNADGKIADVLTHCGIADCFETITDSGIVGKEKPHPLIFQTALQSLNVTPEESLYTGDLYSVDYLGATNVGMNSVLFDRCGAYKQRALPRVESLEQLEEYLRNSDQCGAEPALSD
jgi:putative hydrolase of the HAD superfamily